MPCGLPIRAICARRAITRPGPPGKRGNHTLAEPCHVVYALDMGYYDPIYYIMKRHAQQEIARGHNIAALLLMEDLRAWWNCANKHSRTARDIWLRCKRGYRRLRFPRDN